MTDPEVPVPHANLTHAEARARARLVGDVSYHVELDLTSEGETFPSRTVARFSGEPGASTFIDLQAPQVRAATLNGEALPADAHDGTRLRLPRLAERNELVVDADPAYQRSGVGLHRFTDPVDQATYLHTQFEPYDANRVYACFDQPDIKAPFALTVRAPSDWTVISNTTPQAPASDGVWRFAPTLPLSTYITAVVAGPLHGVHDTWRSADGKQEIPLGLYCRESLAQHLDADEFLEVTKQGLDYFSEVFGHAYPFGSYDQLLVPEFNWGAMENAACVTFSETYVFRSRVTEAARQSRASTILHEMAHMWFGNLVTMRWWDDLWLNESFATYMGTRALAEATRFTEAWASFCAGLKGWAISQDQLPSTHPIATEIDDTEAVRTHFDGITYAKGASVLKQLVAWVGDEAFFSGLSDYFERHAFDNAELGDFLAALEGPSGRVLGPWSQQWLETSGVATLRPELTEEAGAIRSAELHQEVPEAHPTLRDHRLAVGCYADDGTALRRTRRTELDVRATRTPVPELEGAAVPDLLLANDDDLAFVKLRLDDRSIQTALASLGRVEEPLARALCWGAAWDMARDAELTARRYVTLVAEHAAAETDIAVLQGLVSRAELAANRYAAPDHRHAALRRLGDSARQTLARAAPGSDAQLVWARVRASAAVDADELAWVRALLEGETSVEGVVVDTDLRWHLLAVLAASDQADEARIALEESRDATDMGARRAAAARAARPDPEAKSTAWATLIDDPQATLAMRRAIAGGFWQPGQEALLSPYIDRYPAAIARAWAERNPEEAISLSAGLYPSVIVDQRAMDAADAALNGGALPAPGQRIVAEHRDETWRALRARAVDAASP